MSDEWTPIWVQRIDSEFRAVERERDQHTAMADECQKRMDHLMEKRKPWTDRNDEPSGG